MGRSRQSATLSMAMLIGAVSCSSAKGSSQPTTSLSHVVRVGPAPPADTVKDTPSSGVKACDLVRASDLTAAGTPGSISAGFDSSSNLSLGGDDPSSCEFTISAPPTTWQLFVMIDDGGSGSVPNAREWQRLHRSHRRQGDEPGADRSGRPSFATGPHGSEARRSDDGRRGPTPQTRRADPIQHPPGRTEDTRDARRLDPQPLRPTRRLTRSSVGSSR